MRPLLTLLTVILAATAVAPTIAAQDKGAPLNDRHREWLETEVNYIITDRERDVFLELQDDNLRDQFIQMFWKQRDPTPATMDNEFKDEHYRRLSYANTWFGGRRAKNGWRTDRGRIYILFGEPQQKTKFTGENDIRDCEIWFYDSQRRIRDVSFFRLLFYQKSFGQDFVLYSPTHDGPQELAMQIAPTREQALRYIYERSGQELWETAQSYIPTEPLTSGWSAESELLISKIENYHNTLVDSDWAESFMITEGKVSARLSFRNLPMSLVLRTFYNLNKEAFLHVGFQVRPEDLEVGEINERFYSVFDVRTFVEDLETKAEVLTRADHWETQFQQEAGQIKARPIAFQQAFPLVPGKYRVLWIIDDLIRGTFSFRQAEVEIQGPKSDATVLSVPLMTSRYASLNQAEAGQLYPFRIFNIQYFPDLFSDYNRGDNLSVFFQYLFPKSQPLPSEVRFRIELSSSGQAAGAPPVLFEHAVPRDRLSSDGIVFVHRQIPVADLKPGEYRLKVKALADGVETANSQVVAFSYVGEKLLVRPRPDAYSEPRLLGSPDYVLERSRQLEALGRREDAIRELRSALQNMGEEESIVRRLNSLEETGPTQSPGR